jgi:hypothetical protein
MIEKTTWPELGFRCNGPGGCVIVEHVAGAFVIRDSKNPYQPGLVFSRKEYAEFRRRVKGGSWRQAVAGLVKVIASTVKLIASTVKTVRR